MKMMNHLFPAFLAVAIVLGAGTMVRADHQGEGHGDPDGDGVCGCEDQCPDSKADNISLNPNQYAQNVPFGPFEVGLNNAQSIVYTMADTRGCTCKQIIQKLGVGAGHCKKGCSPSVMEEWTGKSSAPDHGPNGPQ